MIKVTYPLIARYYGKHVQGVKHQAKKTNGMHTLTDLYKILDFYEKKK